MFTERSVSARAEKQRADLGLADRLRASRAFQEPPSSGGETTEPPSSTLASSATRPLLFALPAFGYPTAALEHASLLAIRTGKDLHVLRVLPKSPRPEAVPEENPLIVPAREVERSFVASRETRCWCASVLPERLSVLRTAAEPAHDVAAGVAAERSAGESSE